MRTPEITINSEFGSFIINFIKYNTWIKKVLEIGSGSGNGSTLCFTVSLSQRKNSSLTCIEAHPEWFADLVENTSFFPFTKQLNKTTVSFDNLLVKTFDDYWNDKWNITDPQYSYEFRKTWYEQDLPYFKNTLKGEGAIENNEQYDAVLIDGSEFSGYSEFILLKDRTKCFILDDINCFKCARAHDELLNDNTWELVDQGQERNGWSCFVKVN